MNKDRLINSNLHKEYIIDADLEAIIGTAINNDKIKFFCKINKQILNDSEHLNSAISSLINELQRRDYIIDKAFLIYDYKIHKVDANKLMNKKLETELIREMTDLEIMVNQVDMYELMEEH